MELDKTTAAIETILFAMGDSVEIGDYNLYMNTIYTYSINLTN